MPMYGGGSRLEARFLGAPTAHPLFFSARQSPWTGFHFAAACALAVAAFLCAGLSLRSPPAVLQALHTSLARPMARVGLRAATGEGVALKGRGRLPTHLLTAPDASTPDETEDTSSILESDRTARVSHVIPAAAEKVAEAAGGSRVLGHVRTLVVAVAMALVYGLGLVQLLLKLLVKGLNAVLSYVEVAPAPTPAAGGASLPGSKWSPSLEEHDPELFELVELERERQYRGLEMIASENFTSRAVLQCLGSVLTNKYAEGESGARYYGGNEIIDRVEDLCKARALAAFGLDPETWAVNVQPYSGSPANLAVYAALVEPQSGRLMGLDLPDGGHLTHGYKTPAGKRISVTSLFFDSKPYHVKEDGYIDYAGMRELAEDYRPNILIAGCSAYPRELEYDRFREAADSCGAILMADMAHVSGLVAAREQNDPFEHCDIVTTTTHKSLRGPRAGMIFSRRVHRDGRPTGYPEKINAAVFPGLQGGPHENQIAAIATQLKEVMSPEFQAYAKQIKANARALAHAMMNK
eukprot:EG_transcript_9405